MSVSKSYLYNDCVLHPEADKTLTDGRFSYQYYYSSFDQPKTYPAKDKKKIIIRRKRGPAKTIFGQKSGPAMAGPPTTALKWSSLVRLTTVCQSVLDGFSTVGS